MSRCMYETCETSYGRGDGGYQCTRTAIADCDDCGQAFCPDHVKPCKDCEKVFCTAPMEGRCLGNHAHDPVRMGPVSEQCFATVDRVLGTA
jgi:hypothetical protein